jgi:N-acetylneuraminate lyase
MSEPIHGLVAAAFTPFDRREQIAFDRIPRYAALLVENGVGGVFVGGTTGEGMSLTLTERKRLAAAWTAAASASLRVIVHVGHNCLADCREMAAHAEACGARGFAAIAPSFFRPAAVEDLVAWCKAVAEAAPRLPFYYYHMPAMTGVALPMVAFLEQAAERIPNLAGIKYTYEDLGEFAACRRFDGGRFDVLFGRDQILLSAVRAGARGAVGSTFNFAAPLYLAILRAAETGDDPRAAERQDLARRMIEACQAAGVCELAALKAVMDFAGFPCGPVRLPLRNLTDVQRDRLRAELGRLGFDEWRCRVGHAPRRRWSARRGSGLSSDPAVES